MSGYQDGFRPLSSVPEAGVLGSSSGSISRRRSTAVAPRTSRMPQRKTSLSGFFEESISKSGDVSFSVERTRRISREAASIISSNSQPPPASLKILAVTEKRNHSALSSPILQLYLAKVAIRPLRQKKRRRRAGAGRRIRQYDMDDTEQNGGSGPDSPNNEASSGEEAEVLEDVITRLDAEFNALLQNQRAARSVGQQQTVRYIDINKVYQNLESAAEATYGPNRKVLQRLSSAFMELPQPVVERRRRNREHQVMAPISF